MRDTLSSEDAWLLEQVAYQLLQWHDQGLAMPNYREGHGKTHLLWLMTGNGTPPSDTDDWLRLLRPWLETFKLFLGPNGFTVYKMILAKQGMSDELR